MEGDDHRRCELRDRLDATAHRRHTRVTAE
jgi:hypothetical protein